MTPVTKLPVAMPLSRASSELTMSPCYGRTFAWAVYSEPGCKESTLNRLDAATPPDGEHPDGP